MKKLSIVILIIIFLTACINQQHAYIAPGKQLNTNGKYYLVYTKPDEHDLFNKIKANMENRKLELYSGPKDSIPKNINYLVEYREQWQWDITWYLLNFEIYIYEPKTKYILATSSSIQSSLVRKDVETIINETLNPLFKNNEKSQ